MQSNWGFEWRFSSINYLGLWFQPSGCIFHNIPYHALFLKNQETQLICIIFKFYCQMRGPSRRAWLANRPDPAINSSIGLKFNFNCGFNHMGTFSRIFHSMLFFKKSRNPTHLHNIQILLSNEGTESQSLIGKSIRPNHCLINYTWI